MRKVARSAVLWLCSLSLAAAAAAEDVTGAQGRFESKDVAFNVVDAYAFRAKETLGERPTITVVVSNVGIREQSIDQWLDKKQVFEKRFKDDNTAVVYFEFSPEGVFRGVSYYLNSGNGCGYCSSPDVKSAVKLAAGQLTGPFSLKGKDYGWDITLAVPVAGDDHGPALPPGGGDAGKTYVAYAAAVKGRDAAALKTLMTSRVLGAMAQAEKAGQIEDFLNFVGGQRYVDTVRVVKGYATADRAVLEVAGEGPVGKRSGQVVLRKEASGWRVDEEILDMASGQ